MFSNVRLTKKNVQVFTLKLTQELKLDKIRVDNFQRLFFVTHRLRIKV